MFTSALGIGYINGGIYRRRAKTFNEANLNDGYDYFYNHKRILMAV